MEAKSVARENGSRTRRACHAWWPWWAHAVCADKLQHHRHQHVHPVKRNSWLKSGEHPWDLEYGQWHETLAATSRLDPTPVRRRGREFWPGKVRHPDLGLLWIQHHGSRQNLQTPKAAGPENKADIGTTGVNAETLVKQMTAMNFEEATGRDPRSPKITMDDEANDDGLRLGTESMKKTRMVWRTKTTKQRNQQWTKTSWTNEARAEKTLPRVQHDW